MSITRTWLWMGLALLAYLLPMCWWIYEMEYLPAAIWTLVPAGLIVAWQALVDFQRFLIVMTYFIPLSVPVVNVGGGFGMSFPGEVFAGIAALVLTYNLLRRPSIDRRILAHPLTWAILLQLLWIGATALLSEWSLVSFKFLASRIAYLVVFYLGVIMICAEGERLLKFVWAYMLGFFPVMIFAIFHILTLGVSRNAAPYMAEPFFDDHTLFSACIAMLLPLAVVLWRRRDQLMGGLRRPGRAGWMVLVMLIALALSYSRAAWLSVVVALAFVPVVRLRVPMWAMVAALALGGVGVYTQRAALYEVLSQNNNNSGDDVIQSAKSITNVSTDDSNKERVNRWASALAMWEERPWVGWGPGTYERVYGPFQATWQLTRISTKDGDRGDAHSEYLTALSEQGIIGLFIHLIMLGTIFATGLRVAYRAKDPLLRIVAAALVLGFLTYLIHGAVNSFLDLDKAATLIWGLAGMMVALDVYHREEEGVFRPLEGGAVSRGSGK